MVEGAKADTVPGVTTSAAKSDECQTTKFAHEITDGQAKDAPYATLPLPERTLCLGPPEAEIRAIPMPAVAAAGGDWPALTKKSGQMSKRHGKSDAATLQRASPEVAFAQPNKLRDVRVGRKRITITPTSHRHLTAHTKTENQHT